jgi:hypothetical protein
MSGSLNAVKDSALSALTAGALMGAAGMIVGHPIGMGAMIATSYFSGSCGFKLIENLSERFNSIKNPIIMTAFSIMNLVISIKLGVFVTSIVDASLGLHHFVILGGIFGFGAAITLTATVLAIAGTLYIIKSSNPRT